MSIWFKTYTLDQINDRGHDTMVEYLDIKATKMTDDSLTFTMPVSPKVIQPIGIVHGGASCVLAESAGSIASHLCVDIEKQYCVGLDINANHLRQVRSGFITAIAKPLHIGHKSHVWDIRLYREDQKMSCISRLTMMVMDKL